METQAVEFGERVYCTVFIVQNEIVTVLDTFEGAQQRVRQWLHDKGFPSSGHKLQPKTPEAVPEGYYINPGLGPFYYKVDPRTNGLTAASPQAFHVPVVLENL